MTCKTTQHIANHVNY